MCMKKNLFLLFISVVLFLLPFHQLFFCTFKNLFVMIQCHPSCIQSRQEIRDCERSRSFTNTSSQLHHATRRPRQNNVPTFLMGFKSGEFGGFQNKSEHLSILGDFQVFLCLRGGWGGCPAR